jgi:hypothetical protein
MSNHWLSVRKQRKKNTTFYFELIGEFPESLVKFEMANSGGQQSMFVNTGKPAMFITTGSTAMTSYLISLCQKGKLPPVTDGILKVCYQGDLKEVWSLQDVRPIQIGLDSQRNSSYVGHFCFDCSNMDQIISKYF